MKTAPQIRLEDFWKELENKTEIKLKDIDKLGNLLSDFIQRCNQFVEEARESRDMWRKKFEKKQRTNI